MTAEPITAIEEEAGPDYGRLQWRIAIGFVLGLVAGIVTYTLAGEGRGRKTVVSVSEKPVAGATMAKSQGAADGLSANEFMAKALAAQASGRLTGLDVARAESALNKGLPVPQDVVNRVIQ